MRGRRPPLNTTVKTAGPPAGTNSKDEKYELRPSFMAHAGDLRNLCSVRDWRSAYKMDEMRRWELVTPCPTVEYEYDGGKGKKSLYVPKMRLTYYLYEEAMQPFIETVRAPRGDHVAAESSPRNIQLRSRGVAANSSRRNMNVAAAASPRTRLDGI